MNNYHFILKIAKIQSDNLNLWFVFCYFEQFSNELKTIKSRKFIKKLIYTKIHGFSNLKTNLIINFQDLLVFFVSFLIIDIQLNRLTNVIGKFLSQFAIRYKVCWCLILKEFSLKFSIKIMEIHIN